MKAIQKRSQQTEEKILTAAELQLNQNPFVELTIPLIVKQACVSTGGIYARFKSREDLLQAVYARYRQRRDERILHLINANDSAGKVEARLKAATQMFVDLHYEEMGVLRSFLISKWLTVGKKPEQAVVNEVADHTDAITRFIVGDAFDNPEQIERLKLCVTYLISLSKDNLVIKPTSIKDLKRIDRKQLVLDITVMVYSLISQIGK